MKRSIKTAPPGAKEPKTPRIRVNGMKPSDTHCLRAGRGLKPALAWQQAIAIVEGSRDAIYVAVTPRRKMKAACPLTGNPMEELPTTRIPDLDE